MKSELIINLAPTGIIPTKAQTPLVPITPEEIASDVLKCAHAGVSMAHLHGRDQDGNASSKLDDMRKIIELIRKDNEDLIVVVSTSGRRVAAVEERAKVLGLEHDLLPDMASLTLGSMNFSNEASLNSPASIMYLAEAMLNRGIKPELEVFDLGMINFAKLLIQKGLLEPPYYFNILLGSPSTAQASLLHLGTMISDLPANSVWSVAGIGRYQLDANTLGLLFADGVRVGLEDNIWFDRERTTLASNLALVERIKAQAKLLERGVASVDTVRGWLGLKSRK